MALDPVKDAGLWERLAEYAHRLRTPPKLDEFSRELSNTLDMDAFDGARFEYHKPVLSAELQQSMTAPKKVFSYGHKLWLGSSLIKEGYLYEFVPNLLLHERTQLAATLDMHGNLLSRVSHVTGPLALTAQMGIPAAPGNPQTFVVDSTFRGQDFVFGARWFHKNYVELQFSQSLTEHWAVGSAVVFPASQLAAIGGGVRYESGNHFVSCSLQPVGAYAASYCRRVNPQFSMGTELKYMPHAREALWTVGLSYQVQDASLKASIDQSGKLTSVFDQIILNVFRLTFSSEIDHGKDEYRFGFGVILG
jgi:hypothetical protein